MPLIISTLCAYVLVLSPSVITGFRLPSCTSIRRFLRKTRLLGSDLGRVVIVDPSISNCAFRLLCPIKNCALSVCTSFLWALMTNGWVLLRVALIRTLFLRRTTSCRPLLKCMLIVSRAPRPTRALLVRRKACRLLAVACRLVS